MPLKNPCREKIESDRRRTLEEREADATWMRGVLAREAEQIAEEDALRERQTLELQRWLHALKTASHAEALVCVIHLLLHYALKAPRAFIR